VSGILAYLRYRGASDIKWGERERKRAKEHNSYYNTLAVRNGHMLLWPALNHGNFMGPESYAIRRHQAGVILNGTYIHELPWNSRSLPSAMLFR